MTNKKLRNNLLDSKHLSARIKELAARHGFDACGISEACFLEESAPRLEKWLAQGHHGTMGYMERNFDKRLDPRLLVPGAKSIVSLLMNYFPSAALPHERRPNVPLFAKYSYGEDYHVVLREKMHSICAALKSEAGDFSYRVFTDSAPVLEREWARRAGLGWIGKNSHLIIPQAGSYFFLSEIILDLPLEYDAPDTMQDRCGACRRCQMACPTGAIDGSRTIDASRCLSYLTIELKSEIPDSYVSKLGGRAYGCDACIDACPWNKFAKPSSQPRFSPQGNFLDLTCNEWLDMNEDTFTEKFSRTAFYRTGLDKIKSTIAKL